MIELTEAFPAVPEIHEAVLETFENLQEVDNNDIIGKTLETTGGYAWQLIVTLQGARAQVAENATSTDEISAPPPHAVINALRSVLDHLGGGDDEKGEPLPLRAVDIEAVLAAAQWHPSDIRVLAYASELLAAMSEDMERELLVLAVVPRLERMVERLHKEKDSGVLPRESVRAWVPCVATLEKNLKLLNKMLMKAAKDMEKEAAADPTEN